MSSHKGKIMKFILSIVCFLCICCYVSGQNSHPGWYSETEQNGIIIQNSLPKGGPYQGATTGHYNPSYLVFFTRIINKTDKPLELDLDLSADSMAIPNSPDTYVKLFLPKETISMDKRSLFSYGITELASLYQATSFKKIIAPNEDGLFYVVAFFYQTRPDAWSQERGGNRAELVLKGQNLYYNLLPQIDHLPVGQLIFDQ